MTLCNKVTKTGHYYKILKRPNITKNEKNYTFSMYNIEKISRRKTQDIIRDREKARHLKEEAQAIVACAQKLFSYCDSLVR